MRPRGERAGGQHTVEVRRTNKRNVNTQVAMVGRAVETQVDAEGHRCPGRVLSTAVEADLCEVPSQPRAMGFPQVEESICANLVCRLRLQLLKQLLRLLLRREPAHRGDGFAGLGWIGLLCGPDMGECVKRCVLVGRPKKQPVCMRPWERKGGRGRVESEKGFLAISGVGPDFASGIDEWMLSKHLQGGRVDACLGD